MTTYKIKPLGNKVLVKRSAAATTKGGILLPDSAQEKPKQGAVVAVGPGKMEEDGTVMPMEVKENDVVLFSSYAGAEIQGEEDLMILSEDEILAIVE